jgi:hypothetical protein
MARPLMQHGVAQLEQLFAKSKADQKVLKQLEHELQYRQVPRAVALLAEVQAQLHLEVPGTPPVPSSPAITPPNLRLRQPDLYERSPVSTSAAEQPQPRERPAATSVPPPAPSAQSPTSQPPLLQLHTPPAMSIEEAYKVLRATPGSTWESIEHTRRQFVQQAHPARIASLSMEKRAQLQADAKRLNTAYAVLSRQRTGET